MALPKLTTPTYELEIPSTDEKISYRPFLVKEEKILLMFKDSYLLEKGINEQKVQQKKGNIAVLHLNPCDDLAKANQIMNENNCSEILWVK